MNDTYFKSFMNMDNRKRSLTVKSLIPPMKKLRLNDDDTEPPESEKQRIINEAGGPKSHPSDTNASPLLVLLLRQRFWKSVSSKSKPTYKAPQKTYSEISSMSIESLKNYVEHISEMDRYNRIIKKPHPMELLSYIYRVALYVAIKKTREVYMHELLAFKAVLPSARGKGLAEWVPTTRSFLKRKCVPDPLIDRIMLKVYEYRDVYIQDHV
ncbi:hypothetical protein ACOME3_005144 [Neoechinorhynchus agilis]